MIAYYILMRQAEILNLAWEEIDLNNQFIRLGGQRTKNKTGRVIPFNQRIFNYLISLPLLFMVVMFLSKDGGTGENL